MKKTFVFGDIHGSFKPIRDFYLRNKEKEKFDGSDTIILLGDAGLNYYLHSRDDEVKAKLGRYPFTYFIVRGNHEERPSICASKNPEKWTKETFWGNSVWVEKEYPYIKYAEDGPAVYNIPYVAIPASLRDDNEETGDIEWEDLMGEWKTLVLPGAYSVDKDFRLRMGWSWFPNEQMSIEEREQAWDIIRENNYKFDIILSHTCPCSFEPTDLFLDFIDQSTVDKDTERFLGAIEYALEDYKAWLWGHYHAFRDYPREEDGRRKLMLYGIPIELKQFMEEDFPIKL